ncbi:MAG: hypothetical protein FWD61_20320 [Phycisphaerales bacterium]|nr:hypothetical protein [Phycisphaerales bacterium]
MPDQVRVEDLEAFRIFRAALHKFALIAQQSLTSAQASIDRTHSWLENEQRTHWNSQHKKRAEAVVHARDAVRQKKLYKDSSGRTPSAIEEEKHLRRCLAAVQEAEDKILAVKKAIPRLVKESELYRGGIARLGRAISGDIPHAIALLDRFADTLEEYIQLEAPDTLTPDSVAPTVYEESMSRGGESAGSDPALRGGDSEKFSREPIGERSDAPATTEDTHVPDGK